MRRLAYRQVHYSNSTTYPTGPVKPLRLAPSGAVGNPGNVFGKRHLERIPNSCAFSAKGKGGKTSASRKNMVDLGHSSGNRMGSPQNKGNGEAPLWSPQKIYWLIDDLVYHAVEAGYNQLNKLAKKLGKKTPIVREVVAVGAVALGKTPDTFIVPTPEGGCEWGINPIMVPSFVALVGISTWLAITKRKSDKEDANANAISFSSVALAPLGIIRGPAVALSAFFAGKAAFMDSPLKSIQVAAMLVGIGIYCYLMGNENGTGKKVKDALGELGAKLHLGLAKKSQVSVKNPK